MTQYNPCDYCKAKVCNDCRVHQLEEATKSIPDAMIKTSKFTNFNNPPLK